MPSERTNRSLAEALYDVGVAHLPEMTAESRAVIDEAIDRLRSADTADRAMREFHAAYQEWLQGPDATAEDEALIFAARAMFDAAGVLSGSEESGDE